MLTEIILTVSESKRLIAKGVAAMPAVRKALTDGIVAIATGSTNGYVVEEITGRPIQKPAYMTGATLPHGVRRDGLLSRDVPDVVLHKGKPLAGVTTTGIAQQMSAGDVFIKGANALYYPDRRAGILIGHPTGGTLGAVLGTIIARRITFVIPVGLEKCVAQPIESVAEFIRCDAEGTIPSIWPIDGEIVTEIEALKILTGVEAMQSAAGGIAGAEGAVRLVLRGTKEQIAAAEALANAVHGEPPFIPLAEARA